jgi:hypothetical protein
MLTGRTPTIMGRCRERISAAPLRPMSCRSTHRVACARYLEALGETPPEMLAGDHYIFT